MRSPKVLQNKRALAHLTLKGLEDEHQAAYRAFAGNPTNWHFDERVKRVGKDGKKHYVCRLRLEVDRKTGFTRKKFRRATEADAYGREVCVRLARFKALLDAQAAAAQEQPVEVTPIDAVMAEAG